MDFPLAYMANSYKTIYLKKEDLSNLTSLLFDAQFIIPDSSTAIDVKAIESL
jgi:hypothetical protein